MKRASFRFYNCRCLLTILLLFLLWQTMCQQCLPKTNGFLQPHFLFIQSAKMLHKAENKRVLIKHIATNSNRIVGYFNHDHVRHVHYSLHAVRSLWLRVHMTNVVQIVRKTFRTEQRLYSLANSEHTANGFVSGKQAWSLPAENKFPFYIKITQKICSAVEHNDLTKPRCEPLSTFEYYFSLESQRIEHKVECYHAFGLTRKWHCAVKILGRLVFITLNKRNQVTKIYIFRPNSPQLLSLFGESLIS